MDDKNLHIKHKEKIKSMMTNEPFSTYLGIELLDIGEGSATAHLLVTNEMLNAHGTVHGGVVFSFRGGMQILWEISCRSFEYGSFYGCSEQQFKAYSLCNRRKKK